MGSFAMYSVFFLFTWISTSAGDYTCWPTRESKNCVPKMTRKSKTHVISHMLLCWSWHILVPFSAARVTSVARKIARAHQPLIAHPWQIVTFLKAAGKQVREMSVCIKYSSTGFTNQREKNSTNLLTAGRSFNNFTATVALMQVLALFISLKLANTHL